MTQRFDLVVIGTGTAASGVASRCRNAGWSVAIVDERPFGGTCALRGCDPKKVLRRAAEVVDASRRGDVLRKKLSALRRSHAAARILFSKPLAGPSSVGPVGGG